MVVLGGVMAASIREELTTLLRRQPDRPRMAGLVIALEKFADAVKESQLKGDT